MLVLGPAPGLLAAPEGPDPMPTPAPAPTPAPHPTPARPSTPPAPGPAPAPTPGSDYVLSSGDVIDVVVVGQADLTNTYTIAPDGTIQLPLLGRVRAAGRTVPQLTQALTQAYRRYLRRPVVTVRLREVRGNRVAVMGLVRAPGAYPIKDGDRVLDAVVMAGGQTERGDLSNVSLLRRTGGKEPQVVRLDLRRAMQGDMAHNSVLRDRDVIYVAEVGTPDPAKIMPWAQLLLLAFRLFGF